MSIYEECCSLELSKRLKELDVPQNSLFAWVKPASNPAEHSCLVYRPHGLWADEIAAFTLHEIFSLLPFRFNKYEKLNMLCRRNNRTSEYVDLKIKHDYHIKLSKVDTSPTEWYCWAIGHGYDEHGINISEISFCEHDNNAADACAKMLIFLIENGLMKNEC